MTLKLVGERFGRWVVLSLSDKKNPHGKRLWHCRCDCGTEREVSTGSLRSGISKSCGCRIVEANQSRGHGWCGTSTYTSWRAMLGRVDDANRYIGIKVVPRWRSFENFLSDMGERLPGTTLERKDNNGPYAPWNCCWATKEVQARNSSACKLTEQQVRVIRERYEIGELQSDLASCFCVSPGHISKIVTRRLWREI